MSFVPQPGPDGKRRYGCWAGNPAGRPEDPRRCIEQVAEGGRSMMFHQCERKRGHGPTGEFCRQHAPEAIAARRAKADARYARMKLGWDRDDATRNVVRLAQATFRQEATFNELEAAVEKLNRIEAALQEK